MKQIFASIVSLLMMQVSANAQFWQGFLYGLGQGARQLNQQSQSRQQRSAWGKIFEELHYEDDGFEWTELWQYNSDTDKIRYGIKSETGRRLVSPSSNYENISYYSEKGHGGYFELEKSGKTEIRDRHGKILFNLAKTEFLFSEGYFHKKINGEWVKTRCRLDSDGHGKWDSSGASDNNIPYVPYVGTYSSPTPAYNGNSSNSSTEDYKEQQRRIHNQTAGEKCLTCKGDGKCIGCHGTGYATDNLFGNGIDYSKTCSVCDGKKICTSCGGTGKAPWNR